MKTGYDSIKVSEQKTYNRSETVKLLGVNRIFIETVHSTETKRPILTLMLDNLQDNDVVIVKQIDKIARNVRDFIKIMSTLKEKNVDFVSLKEKIDTREDKNFYNIILSMEYLDKKYIMQRQRDGMERAYASGKIKGRPRIEIDNQKFVALYKEWKLCKVTAKYCMKELGLKPNTFYRYVKEFESKQ